VRRFRTAAASAAWSTALAIASGSGLPVVAAEVDGDQADIARERLRGGAASAAPEAEAATVETSAHETAAFERRTSDSGAAVGASWFRRPAVADPGLEGSIETRAVHEMTGLRMAQFQLPPPPPPAAAPEDIRDRPPRPFVGQLTYQYAYGSESSVVYRRNADLNNAVQDNITIVTPNVNGVVIYRPTDWLVATLEMVAEVEIPVQQPETITLPNGETVPDIPTMSSLLVDQGFVTIRGLTPPLEFNVGRRNYEDERKWLYDTSLDIVSILFREGAFRAEWSAGRQVWVNMNLVPNQVQTRDRINTSMLYVDYRGIEDLRLAAYTIDREDLDRNLGRPRLWGVRAMGRPSENLNFWADLAYLAGWDATGRKFAGRGFDIGVTYQDIRHPLHPNFTLSYAYGSGDDNPDDDKNHTFHQTGLESNESRWAGFAKFKYYGEVLEPQLSNLKIFTVGIGARPTPGFSIDLVYHRYWLDKIADEIPGSPITALMAQFDPLLSKNVGSALDLVLGFRQLFGLRRLGVDVRVGWFFPGPAYVRNDGTDENPILRGADKGFTVVAKFWW
jgi:alginate production protein